MFGAATALTPDDNQRSFLIAQTRVSTQRSQAHKVPVPANKASASPVMHAPNVCLCSYRENVNLLLQALSKETSLPLFHCGKCVAKIAEVKRSAIHAQFWSNAI